jgi:hypothetical protein
VSGQRLDAKALAKAIEAAHAEWLLWDDADPGCWPRTVSIALTTYEAAKPQEMFDEFEVDVAIAEALALLPRDTCYEDKGTAIREILRKNGYQIVRIV